MKHAMADAETLGTKADAVMLSLGVVLFDLDSDEIGETGFYAVFSIDDQLQLGRKIDESTLKWWFEQSKEAQAVFSQPGEPMVDVLLKLNKWLGHNKRLIWSNGASFDIPMLEHMYASVGLNAPWEFWNSRCVRTYRSLPGAERVARIEPTIKHHALHDAIAQAKTVQAIQRVLKA